MEQERNENGVLSDAQETVAFAEDPNSADEVVQKRSAAEEERIRYRRKQAVIRQLKPLIFIGPHLLFFCIFLIFPFFFGIYISFFRWDVIGAGKAEFVGFGNYLQIFDWGGTFNREFFEGLGRTCLYVVVMVPLLICVPMLFAVLLSALKNKTARTVFQAIMYASSLLSVATVVIVWQLMTDQDNGLINNILNMDLNRNYQPYAWIFIFALTIWSGVGGNMVIFMAGLSNIPTTYYEAADIDGANAFVKFWHISLPSMRFQLLYTTVMGTIGAFNVYGQPALFGGDNTEVLMINIKNNLDIGLAGMASAMAVLLGIIISIFSGLQFKMMEKGE